MTTLAEFLLARIAEDEQCALAALPMWDTDDDAAARGDMHGHSFRHSNRHDPARVLAECDAKRRIVEQSGNAHFMAAQHDSTLGDKFIWEYALGTLSLLALPYADHPDYQEAWKP